MKPLRVLIVADDPLARAGLAMMLAGAESCIVVGQENSDADLIAASELYQADAVLWDLGWDGVQNQSTLEYLSDLSEMLPPLIVLLSDVEEEKDVIGGVWAAGMRGLLRRDAGVDVLEAALNAVVMGLIILDPDFARVLFRTSETGTSTLPEALTPRESEVLYLVAEGLPNKAIAHQLGISEHTVKFHVNAIMGKLGAQSRTEAVVQATRLGLILL